MIAVSRYRANHAKYLYLNHYLSRKAVVEALTKGFMI